MWLMSPDMSADTSCKRNNSASKSEGIFCCILWQIKTSFCGLFYSEAPMMWIQCLSPPNLRNDLKCDLENWNMISSER
jgi:hypothetical protein